MSTFSERLEQIREDAGLKGSDFAEQLGIPYRSYMNYKGGRTPPAEVLAAVIESFDVNPVWLMTGDGEVYPESPAEPEPDPTPPKRPSGPGIADLGARENESPAELQMRLMSHVMDLYEENRSLRQQVEKLEYELAKSRSQARRMARR